jgi:adenosylhomocysteine nucleosidase
LAASDLGAVVGLRAEARLLAGAPVAVAIGGGSPGGARLAAQRLVAQGAGALLSFGLAGGLNPALPPGALLIPRGVIERGETYLCDAALLRRLGGPNREAIAASDRIAATAAEKRALFEASGADAVDLESGALAQVARQAGLPFAVLRAVADPAERALPPAALVALDPGGQIALRALLASLLKRPGQVAALLALAADAAKARATLRRALRRLR